MPAVEPGNHHQVKRMVEEVVAFLFGGLRREMSRQVVWMLTVRPSSSRMGLAIISNQT
jgi:hypothetical protein